VSAVHAVRPGPPDAGCLFCALDSPDNKILDLGEAATETCYVRLDNFPAFGREGGHLQIVPYRHVERRDDLTVQEAADTHKAFVWLTRVYFPETFGAWQANVGGNLGPDAGQIIRHAHTYVRQAGDLPDPRGGITRGLPGRDPNLWSPTPRATARGGDAVPPR